MLTLNQDYETDIRFSVSVKGVPDDVKISSQDQEVLVRVRDRGTTLMNYKLGSFLPISVNYSEFLNKKGRLLLSAEMLQKNIKKQLSSSTTFLAFSPDTLIYYTQESATRFPVALNGAFKPARQYALGDVVLALPAVSPEVDAAACAFGRFKRIDGGYTPSRTAVEVGILRHVTGGKFPFRFRRQTVRVAGSPAFRF